MADLTGSYRVIWLVLALVLAVALVPAALVRERGERDLTDARFSAERASGDVCPN